MRLVGRRADGASAAVTLEGSLPYFYLRLDGGLLHEDAWGVLPHCVRCSCLLGS